MARSTSRLADRRVRRHRLDGAPFSQRVPSGDHRTYHVESGTDGSAAFVVFSSAKVTRFVPAAVGEVDVARIKEGHLPGFPRRHRDGRVHGRRRDPTPGSVQGGHGRHLRGLHRPRARATSPRATRASSTSSATGSARTASTHPSSASTPPAPPSASSPTSESASSDARVHDRSVQQRVHEDRDQRPGERLDEADAGVGDPERHRGRVIGADPAL